MATFEINSRSGFVGTIPRQLQRFAQCGDRDYASAGSDDIAIRHAGAGVKHMHIVKRRRFGQSRDLPASFVLFRVTPEASTTVTEVRLSHSMFT